MEESKLLSYAELRDKILLDGKKYFKNPQLRKNNYEINIKEEKDAFQTPTDMVFISDSKNQEQVSPAYDLMIVYENYVRSRDADKVIRMLAATMESQYSLQSEPMQAEMSEGCIITKTMEGSEEVGSVYVLAEESLKYGTSEILAKDDVLIPIAEKEKSNLQVVPYGENAVLAIPVNSLEEYAENLEVLAELRQLELEQIMEPESQVYDRERNMIVNDPEEIKELLIKGKVKKKGIFTK